VNTAVAPPAVAPEPVRLSTAYLPPLRELLDYLATLHGLLVELVEQSRRKLDALRRADPAALDACTATEGELLRQVFAAAQGRAAVLARLAQALHVPDARALRLSAVADLVPEPLASTVRARCAAVAAEAGELQRKNRVAAEVARSLQEHLRGVFAELAAASREARGYGPEGRPAAGGARTWMDAVG